MRALTIFASKFGAQIALNPEFILEKAQRYFLLNPSLRKVMCKDFFYAGVYLGKVKEGAFFPSFNFLNMLMGMETNKVVLNRKASWLFICGRDIFQQGVTKATGPQRKGDCTLVLNEYGECLGFGVVADSLKEQNGKVAIRNVLDVGDFLRREI